MENQIFSSNCSWLVATTRINISQSVWPDSNIHKIVKWFIFIFTDFRSESENDTNPYLQAVEEVNYLLNTNLTGNLNITSVSQKKKSYLEIFSKTVFGEKLLHFFSIFLPMLLIAGTFILIFCKVLNVLEVTKFSWYAQSYLQIYYF